MCVLAENSNNVSSYCTITLPEIDVVFNPQAVLGKNLDAVVSVQPILEARIMEFLCYLVQFMIINTWP